MPGTPTYTLNDGQTLPQVGFGTYPLRGDDGIAAIVSAIEVGYRLLDTAVNYENEREVGEAIRRPRASPATSCSSPASSPVATTGTTRRCAAPRLAGAARTGLPRPAPHPLAEPERRPVRRRVAGAGRSCASRAWSARSASRTSPRRSSTGIIDETGVTPAVNQVELHPYFPQAELRAVHERLGIRTESWSPLGKRDGAVRRSP